MPQHASDKPYTVAKQAPALYPSSASATERLTQRAGSDAADQFCNRLRLALVRWNQYFAGHADADRDTFLETALWLLSSEVRTSGAVGGWPIGDGLVAPVLSARAQGLALSVLWRAYDLTGDAAFSRGADRAFQTLARDILDGGVASPLGDGNLILEDTARFPAAHALRGHLLGLLSLIDYARNVNKPEASALVQRLHGALPRALAAYDDGRWVAEDLLDEVPARRAELRELIGLLRAIASCTGCGECWEAATRWEGYYGSLVARARAARRRGRRTLSRILWRGAGALLGLRRRRFAAPDDSRVGVSLPIKAFPFAGGMRTVLDGWRLAMADDWRMEFLTAHQAPDVGERMVLRFSDRAWPPVGAYTPSEFPQVLLYLALGFVGLRRVIRRSPPYQTIIPQDGVFTAAIAVVIGKLAGIRVVAVDHGNVRDAYDQTYYAELRERLVSHRGLSRAMAAVRLALHIRTLRALGRFATRRADHFLVASDDIGDTYRRTLGVPEHRITRFPFMIDDLRYAPGDATERTRMRAELGLPVDAIIITVVSRLHPVKGIDTGIRAVERAYAALPPEARERVFLLIAGDGVLREQVVEQIAASMLRRQSYLWGEATPDDVARLLRLSDIFLYPARRGINSMAVLEAMGAGCATVATVTSPHIAEYLADERGIAVPVEDVEAMARGLATLVTDDERRAETGRRAHEYVAQYHTASAVRRCLLRVTPWTPPAVSLS